MYVTRPLSLYKKHPSELSMEPPEGPYTGYLVITDEEAEAQEAKCWGICRKKRIKTLPFPQDGILSVVPSSSDRYREEAVVKKKVWFVPVLDLPLSSNCYYIVKAKGKYKGQVYTSSREMDMSLCCFKSVINDVKPKPFDHTRNNIYQQFKIHRFHANTFFAKSLSPNGFPPEFLRRKGWKLNKSKSSSSYSHHFTEALGLDSSLRTRLPSLEEAAAVVVGKWYCPFLFVREEAVRMKEQLKRTMLYSVTLEKFWEEIYSSNCSSEEGGNSVVVKLKVKREVDYVGGGAMEAVKVGGRDGGGFVWYRGRRGLGLGLGVGLSWTVVERMKMVEEEGGWVDGEERNVVEVEIGICSCRDEEEEEEEERRVRVRVCCCCCWYMLVERFVFRRMDGSVVLTCNFRHTHQIICKSQ